VAGTDMTAASPLRDLELPGRLQRLCHDAGVLIAPLGPGIAVSPPLIIADDEMAMLADALARRAPLARAA
jgi:putrescine---pyruvate transaminase